MGLIPEEVIAQILDRTDIIDIVSLYIPLKRSGANYKACCPFHDEKTASFVVNAQKQIFHCFGCSEGGNVISFVMKQEKMEFPEAVIFLASRANVIIPENDSSSRKSSNIRQLIFDVNKLAIEYFNNQLVTGQSKETAFARNYLKKRDIRLEIVKEFQLGFALEKWDGLLVFLRQKGVNLSLMEKAGLIICRENKEGYYDRFRNRVIFPILDTKANPRAFGARDLHGSAAKYINSPETPVYVKGQHLYGFHLAKHAISKEDSVIIVEGYMDCIMPYQFGIKNVVASLGTALTVEQIRLLHRYTKNVIMLYDTDQAGQEAIMRSLDVLAEEGMNVKVARLEEGQDPDSFIRSFGVDAFKERINRANSLFDYKYQYLVLKNNASLVEGKAKIATEMLPTIYKFKDSIKKSEYIKKLAQRLDLREEVLILEYNKVGETFFRRLSKAIEHKSVKAKSEYRSTEHFLLKSLLEGEGCIKETQKELSLDDFQHAEVKDVISKIYNLYEQGEEIHLGKLINSFKDSGIQNMLSQLMVKADSSVGDRKRMHQDYLKRIKSDKLKKRVDTIKRQINEAEGKGDQLKLKELMLEFNQLKIKK